MLMNQRRTDNGTEIPLTRAELLTEIAKIDPSFNPAGKSDDYVRARLDAARDDQPSTADAAAAAMRHRMAEAWKAPEQRQDAAKAATKIDPDAAAAKMRKRNEDAWKGKDGTQLLKMIEGDDADENGIGFAGLRHS